MLDLLARHGRLDLERARRAATCRPAPITPSRTSGSASARRSTRRSATAPGSPATARPRCRWTRRAPSCAIDISGRGLCAFEAKLPPGAIGNFDHELTEEFFRALAPNAKLTLHLTVEAGTNAHHMIEAAFKAFARALRAAVAARPDRARRAQHQGDADMSGRDRASSTTEWATAARSRRRSSTSAPACRSPAITTSCDAADGLVVPGVGAFPTGDVQPPRAGARRADPRESDAGTPLLGHLPGDAAAVRAL